MSDSQAADALGERRRVREAVARALGKPSIAEAGGDFSYQSLTGGIERRSYLISIGARRCVLRLPNADGGHVLDLAAEAALMRAAAEEGLAPALVGVDLASAAVLTDYVAGTPWTAKLARRPANIGRAGALLRRLHALPVDLPDFVPDRIAETYLARLDVAREYEPWAEEFVHLAREHHARYACTVPCHNDLVAANILDDGRLWLVDFQYATRAAPILDLASLAGLNDYDASQRRDLIEAYYRDGVAPFTFSELGRVVRLVRLMAFFWALDNEQRTPSRTAYTAFRERIAAVLAADS